MSVRRLTVRVLAALCVLVGLLALWGASAQAAVTHEYLFQFSEVPAEGPRHEQVALPGPVTNLGSMTVDSGHVWISEHMSGTTSYRVDEFNAATGGFLAQPLHSESHEYLGVAVGHLAGEPEADVYVAEYEGGVASVGVYGEAGAARAKWTGAGTPAKSFGVVFDVAADGSGSLSDWAAGDVYAPVEEQKVVDVFKPEAGGAEKYVTQLTGTCATPTSCTEDTFKSPRQVAVDNANGDVLIGDGNVVDVFEPTVLGEYAFVRQLTGTPAGSFQTLSPDGTIAVDSGTGDAYVIDLGKSGQSPVVDQFGPEGVYLGQLTGTPAGPFTRLESVAVDPESHYVYAGNLAFLPEGVVSAVDVFGRGLVVPDVTTGSPSGLKSGSVMLNGTVNPDKAGAASCQFDYGTARSFGQVAPCSTGVAEGESPVPVHAEAGGLQPDTTYYYRLQATNANGTNLGEPWQDQEFTTPGPGIHDESVSDVASTSATLEATIDPHNAPTSYYFQYSTSSTATCTVSSCTSAPAPPGVSIGSTAGDVEATQHVQGLSPAITYHYRVAAISELKAGETETFYGPDQTFVTQHAGGGLVLADGRQWELVSPANKHGSLFSPLSGGVIGAKGPIQAAQDGSGIVYLTDVPTEAEPPGYGLASGVDEVLSRRGPQGWSTRDIATPHDSAPHYFYFPEYTLFSEDLAFGIAEPEGEDQTLLSAEASETTPYLRREALCDSPATKGECFLPLVTGKEGFADVPPGTKFGLLERSFPRVKASGVSSDLRRVLLRSVVALTNTPIPQGAGAELYEWSAGVPQAQALQLVSLLPASEGGGPAGEPETSVGSMNDEYEGARHAVSDDGSRVFWESGTGNFSADRRALYMRDTVKGETVRLDVQQPGAPSGGKPEARFQVASPDGSRVFFTDAQRLTSDAGGQAGGGGDLYECDIVEEAGKLACRLTDLTPERSGRSAEVRNMVLGASEDGSYVYFVANGVLSEAKSSQGEGATQGRCAYTGVLTTATCNLYEYHDGVVTFVATLANGDETDWGVGEETAQWLGNLTSYTSPDGRFLAFMSVRPLTGYDNRDAVSGQPDVEVYLYDGQTGRLACISCNPTGARPSGVENKEYEAEFSKTEAHRENVASVLHSYSKLNWTAADLPAAISLVRGAETLYQPRLVSEGGRVFFNSSDALVPQDVNGSEDVYEFEPEGMGSCTASSSTFNPKTVGCVSLVSSGTASDESGLLDVSKSGSDVFFLTTSRLSSQDYDTSRDVYDAHVCTASVPCVTPPVSVPPCATGDACKGAPAPQPSIFGAPASATFNGTGNVVLSAKPARVAGRTLTRAQKLARALRACRKKPQRERSACERRARRRYAVKGVRTGARATRKVRG